MMPRARKFEAMTCAHEQGGIRSSQYVRATLARFCFAVLVVSGALSSAQAQNLETDLAETLAGADVYAKTCANQYCHGAEGKAGPAPALAGRGFDRDYVMRVTRDGIADTSMPGWGKQLPLEEIEAVVTYVFSLQQTAAEPTGMNLAPDRPWLSHPGRALFFDAARVGACGSCHLFDGWGVAVAPPLKEPFADNVAGLRAFAASTVQTAQPSGEEAFPALPLTGKGGPAQVFDLSAKLPVLRTFPRDRVKLSTGTEWRHGDAITIYNDKELAEILTFLRQAASGQPVGEPAAK